VSIHLTKVERGRGDSQSQQQPNGRGGGPTGSRLRRPFTACAATEPFFGGSGEPHEAQRGSRDASPAFATETAARKRSLERPSQNLVEEKELKKYNAYVSINIANQLILRLNSTALRS